MSPGGAPWEMKEILRVVACSSTMELLSRDRSLGPSEWERISDTIRARLSGYPLAYVLGEAPFMDFYVKVRPGVFIPRLETELIVSEAGAWLASREGCPVQALDLGAGSGNIAIALARLSERVRVDAVEFAGVAAAVFEENLRDHGLEGRVRLNKFDFTQHDTSLLQGAYDLIVSNPPYVSDADLDGLPPDVRHEPRTALRGGPRGDEVLRHILLHMPSRLKKGGRMILEMGMGQARGLTDLIEAMGSLRMAEAVKDENGIERVLVLDKA